MQREPGTEGEQLGPVASCPWENQGDPGIVSTCGPESYTLAPRAEQKEQQLAVASLWCM